jgi:hypothetical protein
MKLKIHLSLSCVVLQPPNGVLALNSSFYFRINSVRETLSSRQQLFQNPKVNRMAVNTGNPELDRKVEDWLKWDKVCKN